MKDIMQAAFMIGLIMIVAEIMVKISDQLNE
jgi:hypothetical protein